MERGRVSANGAWGRKAVAQIELIARHRYVYKQARERQPETETGGRVEGEARALIAGHISIKRPGFE